MSDFIENGIKSTKDVVIFLINSKLYIDRVKDVDTTSNIIYLAEYTTINWKSGNPKHPEDAQIRLNCKEPIMKVIESNSKFRHIDNGPGDRKTHPYSFLINTVEELSSVVEALKTKETLRSR